MKKEAVQLGEIILIPVSGSYLPAKILYISKYFRNVILLGLYENLVDKPILPDDIFDEFKATYYTSKDIVKTGRWISTGKVMPLKDSECKLSKRIVGGDIWVDDIHLGPASEDEYKTLPQMSVLGAALLEKKAAMLANTRKVKAS